MMTANKIYGKKEETIISALSELYRQYGYKRYKPGSFEEYSLYQENKDFLIGKNVITFSDLNGKLMAIRPDITLSLIRHCSIPTLSSDKYFYNEKVYRQSAGAKNYKEISQTGVEVVGAIDGAVVCELTILICKTLGSISKNYLLDISHIGFTEGLLDEFPDNREIISSYLKSKNLHDFYSLAKKEGYSEKLIQAFEVAVKAEGSADKALEYAKSAILNSTMRDAIAELQSIYDVLAGLGYVDKININFSATANADYYNGIIFNGYIEGIPRCVLTGGRYDKLLKKFGKCGGAVGFALYLGEIERYLDSDYESVDYLIIYDEKSQFDALKLSSEYISKGFRVRTSLNKECIDYRDIIDLSLNGGEK